MNSIQQWNIAASRRTFLNRAGMGLGALSELHGKRQQRSFDAVIERLDRLVPTAAS